MERLTRHRKAFYEKENDYQNGNQKLDLYKPYNGKFNYPNQNPYDGLSHQKLPSL